jgi:hypothetical protein
MGDLRDQVDVARAAADRARAAKGGGPRQFAQNLGRARAGARFGKRGKRHKR